MNIIQNKKQKGINKYDIKGKEHVIKTLKQIQKNYVLPYPTKEWYILDEVIEEIKKETVSKQVYEQEYNTRKRFETEILRLESIINNQWISVEENLPEERHAVLVYCPQQKNIYCAYYDKNEWWTFGDIKKQIEFEVVAWRPLPTNPFNDERFGD